MTETGVFDIDLIKIDEIVITNAGIDNNTQLTSLEKDNHYFDINFGFESGVNLPQKKFRLVFSCNMSTFTKDDIKVDVSGRFDIVFYFIVENLDTLTRVDSENGLVINSDFVTSLANIVYSTSRGIIYTRCQGTILKHTILPILSTKDLLKLIGVDDETPTT